LALLGTGARCEEYGIFVGEVEAKKDERAESSRCFPSSPAKSCIDLWFAVQKTPLITGSLNGTRIAV
jgi:hypothetical protein